MEFQTINGQKLCPYAKRRFGWKRFGKNGCGILAAYNALGLLGAPKDFESVFGHFQKWYRTHIFGILPYRIARFLRKNRISCRKEKDLAQLSADLKKGGAAILTYWNRTWFGKIPNIFGGAHTVAVHFDGDYEVFNRFSNRKKIYRFKGLSEPLEGCSLMRAYYLERMD